MRRPFSRRSVLKAGTALVASGLALAACAGTTAASLASDARLVLAGAQSLGDAVMQIANVPADTASKIDGYLQTVENGATAIAGGTAGDTTVVSEVVDGIKAVVPIVLPLLPGGSVMVPVANALLSMVPALLAYVGIAGAGPVTAVYTPDQARLILRAAH